MSQEHYYLLLLLFRRIMKVVDRDELSTNNKLSSFRFKSSLYIKFMAVQSLYFLFKEFFTHRLCSVCVVDLEHVLTLKV